MKTILIFDIVSIVIVWWIYRFGCYAENRYNNSLKAGSWSHNIPLFGPNARLQAALERCQDIDNLNAWHIAHPQGPTSFKEREELANLALYAITSHMMCRYAHGQPIMDQETWERLNGQIPDWTV
jgi:hypothetical protein